MQRRISFLARILASILFITSANGQELIGYTPSIGITKYNVSTNITTAAVSRPGFTADMGISTFDDSNQRYFTAHWFGNPQILYTADIAAGTMRADTLPKQNVFYLWAIEYDQNKLYAWWSDGFGYFDLATYKFITTDTFKMGSLYGGTHTFDKKGKRVFFLASGNPDTLVSYNILTKKFTKYPIPVDHWGWSQIEYSEKRNKIYSFDNTGIVSFDLATEKISVLSTAAMRQCQAICCNSCFDQKNDIYYFLQGVQGISIDTLVAFDTKTSQVTKWQFDYDLVAQNFELSPTWALHSNSVPKKLKHAIYPNPAKNVLTIDFPEKRFDSYTLVLTNIAGGSIFKKLNAEQKEEIQIADVPAGTYTLQIRSTTGIAYTGSILIRK